MQITSFGSAELYNRSTNDRITLLELMGYMTHNIGFTVIDRKTGLDVTKEIKAKAVKKFKATFRTLSQINIHSALALVDSFESAA